tara:strand:+ start:6142 stop:7266 length:1125 start_codon:yes stop_codon:yes gene_type:complete
MINAKIFIEELKKLGIHFFCGVPDSLMSEFSKSLHFDFSDENHIISTNEGSALGACMGYNLATQKVPLIYMQNSGFGNFINPYTSLLHKDVYNIPFVLLIGWRGEPGIPDEPQHKFQGKITLQLLDLLEIEYLIIDKDSTMNDITDSLKVSITDKRPLALVVKRGAFEADRRTFSIDDSSPLRKEALSKIVNKFSKDTIFVSTTGKLSRELYELRKESNLNCDDLYVVGGMGHASAISHGILQNINKHKVVCLDGDGAVLMHMGNLGILGNSESKNFVHIVFNNSSHESVGGQPNIYKYLNSKQLFESLGYKEVFTFENLDSLDKIDLEDIVGPALVEIKVQNTSDKSLIRPEKSPEENKEIFIDKLKDATTNS